MNDKDKVIAWFKRLGFQPKIDNFQDKLIAQKTVYLLQLKGLGTKFHYGFHVRGPYSRELTNELYANRRDFEQGITGIQPSAREEKVLDEFKTLFEMKPSLLEVASSYAYFIASEHLDPVEAIRKVKEVKPFISETNVAVGISRVKEFLFPPSAKDLETARKEHAPWQEAEASTIERDEHEERRNMAG